MSFAGLIGFQLDQLMQNIARLQEQAAVLPERSEIVQVDGAADEPAQRSFRGDLIKVAGQLALETQKVRKFVENNAEAFERAAAAMQDTDGAESLTARRADAFVQGIVADPPTTGSSSSSSSKPDDAW
ncbi:hypothetical protein [Microbacterium sp. 18062]|uniref:hypothetical protein n=1 Tax=Microbacterium sp. 18062 TaxID=2681410 RepID=UPI00135AFA7F|nr:hypothetical protein [Microbacterium sp. 18062]